MQSNCQFGVRVLTLFAVLFLGGLAGFAGVSRAIQEQYKRDYENKAMFLKIPIYAERQFVYISGQTFRIEPGSGSPRYKVGDQLRIVGIEFTGDEVKFRMSGIANPGFVEIAFKFDSSLQESFPNRDVLDRAIQASLTEGLRYKDIDDAKDNFVTDKFERSVHEIADSASLSRESVLKSIAPRIPAFQEAQREIDTLKSRLQDVSAQLNQSQSENRKLESDSRAQQAELSRLKSANAALQEKIDNSTSQISRLGDELRDVRGNAQGYQRELANIQRSLNLRVDASRDLVTQITELGQAMRKIQKDNESLGNQLSSLKTNLDAQQATNARLLGDNEDLKSKNRQMQATISTLTSNEDSLGRKYLDLKNEKEKLDDYSQLIAALRTRITEESAEGGSYTGKANVYLRNTLLGCLDWDIPIYLNHGESKSCKAGFSSESIDYVRLTPEERHLLRSLGSKLKLQMDLVSGSEAMEVKPESNEPFHEIGERDHSSWRWNITNNGTQDARIVLTAHLLNKNSDRVSIIQQEHPLISSNAVRQFRSYLQPVPMILGTLVGFFLFGILGIFLRKRGPARGQPTPRASESVTTVVKKQL
jgi:predicted nuclease with TOPRIM domain